MAKFNKDFEAVFPGEIYPRAFKAGDDCPHEIEAVALVCGVVDGRESAAVREAPRKQSVRRAPEVK